ncbi:hypothetical protein RJ639_018515 [Escallonia herrerae]|uniref:Uncharacterized protein n=1 Tax=Escallonia herrerae TaxID=1293975 RepID=A0AA88VA86_9ASTE|nr:hypothetical protein RJ639_018515 [Escallonia herrerae]
MRIQLRVKSSFSAVQVSSPFGCCAGVGITSLGSSRSILKGEHLNQPVTVSVSLTLRGGGGGGCRVWGREREAVGEEGARAGARICGDKAAEARRAGGGPGGVADGRPEVVLVGEGVEGRGGAAGGGEGWSVQAGEDVGLYDVRVHGGESGGAAFFDGGVRDGDYDEEEDEDDDRGEFDVDEEEDDGENQVVPWSSTTPSPPLPNVKDQKEEEFLKLV